MLKMYTIFVSEPTNFEQILNKQDKLLKDKNNKLEEVEIEYILELSMPVFKLLKNNLTDFY